MAMTASSCARGDAKEVGIESILHGGDVRVGWLRCDEWDLCPMHLVTVK
jgi:hypothetical protein